MGWKKLILFMVVLLIIFQILDSIIFYTTPTKAEVERFFMGNSCNPLNIETDYHSEYLCGRYLRQHTSLIFGKISNAVFPLFTYTPFSYFYYDDPLLSECTSKDSCKKYQHTYVFVVTREGPLVFNPENGRYIGKYEDLMREMGCEVQPYKKPFFPRSPQRFKLVDEIDKCSTKRLDMGSLQEQK